jgi:hypothetical protein
MRVIPLLVLLSPQFNFAGGSFIHHFQKFFVSDNPSPLQWLKSLTDMEWCGIIRTGSQMFCLLPKSRTRLRLHMIAAMTICLWYTNPMVANCSSPSQTLDYILSICIGTMLVNTVAHSKSKCTNIDYLRASLLSSL